MKNLFKITRLNYKQLYMVFPALGVFLWFYILEQVVLFPKHNIFITLDRAIPFNKVFVIPYVFWYIYIAVPLLFFFFKSHKDYIRLSSFLCVGMAIACFIYTIFPNGQPLRPSVLGSDILSFIIKNIYYHDTPTNTFPSIHVIFSIGVHFSLENYFGKKLKFITYSSFIVLVLICMSTVFVKQHSVVDIFGGVAVSGLLYLIIYKEVTISVFEEA